MYETMSKMALNAAITQAARSARLTFFILLVPQ
jgi:hypothetical protein